jgi:hypothetical protein
MILTVQRGEGYTALKAAGQVSKAIQDTSGQTQSVIRQGTDVTQRELKRLQLGQDLAAAQSQLYSIQTELRALQREKRNRVIDRQMKELQAQEASLKTQIQQLQQVLNPQYVSASREQKKKREVDPTTKRGCVSGFVVFTVVGVLLSFVAIPLDKAVFGVASGGSQAGPFMTIVSIIALVMGVLAYFYVTMPGAAIWRPVRKRLNRPSNTEK